MLNGAASTLVTIVVCSMLRPPVSKCIFVTVFSTAHRKKERRIANKRYCPPNSSFKPFNPLGLLIQPLQPELALKDQAIVQPHLANPRRDVQPQFADRQVEILTHRSLFVRCQLIEGFAKDADDALQMVFHAGTATDANPQVLRIVNVTREAGALIEGRLAGQQSSHLGHDLLVRPQIACAEGGELILVAEVHELGDGHPRLGAECGMVIRPVGVASWTGGLGSHGSG